ncbi:MAG: energy transducer TonB [Sedimenticola sp.]|nr:energy transducer TonB [Sedimenticola sp.]
MQASLRLFISLLGGAAVAFSLFWLMQWMLLQDASQRAVQNSRPVMEFVRLKRDPEIRLRNRVLPPEPPPPETPPPPRPEIVAMKTTNLKTLSPDMNFKVPDLPMALNGPYIGPVNQGPPDRDFMPVSRVPPQYPYRAERKGTEGWVKVSFLITENGSVQDVVLIDAEPEGIFEQAAMRAVLKWRFKPRIQNGKPMAVRAEQVVNFRLNRERN